MFDKYAVNEYRSVTAPDDLKNRIFQSAENQTRKPVRYIRVIGTIAACFVLLCVIGTHVYPRNDVSVSAIPSAAMMSYAGAASRSSETYAVISLEADGAIKLRTNDCFYIDKNEQLISIGNRYRAIDQLVLYWPVSTDAASFQANGVAYTLIADPESGNITIVQD